MNRVPQWCLVVCADGTPMGPSLLSAAAISEAAQALAAQIEADALADIIKRLELLGSPASLRKPIP